MIIRNTKSKAFGIVEVLIASSVIIIVATSLTAATSVSLTSTSRTQERNQAINLAQEGIEIVRAIRDTAWIDKDPATSWNKLVAVNTDTPNWSPPTTGQEYSAAFINNAHSPSWHRFYLSTGVDGGKETIILGNSKFLRSIRSESTGALLPGINCSSTADESDKSNCAMKITATVTTPSGADVSVSEVLTNWRPNY